MRLADPELGTRNAPWEQLITPPGSTPSETQAVSIPDTIAENNGTESTTVVRIAPRPPPIRRRHTLGEAINCTLQPLLPRHLFMSHPSNKTNGTETAATFRYRRQSRFSSRRIRKRVVFKHGDCNVVQTNVAKRRRRYLQDIFTTLVDAQWRWTLLVFALNFLLSWLGFALLWYTIAAIHGDLQEKDVRPEIPCVTDLYTFSACFLFSIETQHTIGYGSRSITEECPAAVLAMCIQCISGVMIQAFMVGIVFAKLSRPKKRTQTLLFSHNAVICQRDGQLCLMFRVGDMRRSHIIEAHVRAQLIKQRVSAEGEVLPFYQHELKVGEDGAEDDRIFFIWPTTIVHRIDETSPLYRFSAAEMLRERFEVVVILEGVVESTGMTTQARSSYLPSEVLWGHRFEQMLAFRKENGEYEVDYSRFNKTYEVETPLCSAEGLDQLRRCSVVAIPTGETHSTTGSDSSGENNSEQDQLLPGSPSKSPSPVEEKNNPTLDLPGPESRI